MVNFCKASLSAAAALAALATVVQQAEAQNRKPARIPQVKFTDYRLSNGLRVILSQDRKAPVVAVSVTYNVGSRNERPGRTGFAHLFEHMMFQGSENVGKGEHFVLINDNGGTMNGTTSQDRTNYFEALPANQLELALFLEADRMRSLDISQVNLDNQRAVVQEERRQNVDNQAFGRTFETVLDLAYESFPYRHSTIGSLDDLNAATVEDVREFFRIYYAPNNAVLALVGDFDINDAKRKIQKYFGSIPRQPDPPPVVINESHDRGERRRNLADPLARLTQYTSAYLTVSGDHPDYYALNVLAGILSRGRTSRLYNRLVDTRLALSANAGAAESRGPGLFNISAMVPPGGSAEAVESAIDNEIARIQSDGVSESELARAKANARVGAVNRVQTALGRANALSQLAVYYGDPGRLNTLLKRLESVTAEDVRRVARTYLKKENRVVVITEPARKGEDVR